MLKTIFAATLILSASAATAQLHRCTGADGKTTYTDRACETGERKTGVKIVDNSVDGSELRDAAARSRAEMYAPRNVPAQPQNGGGGSSFECSKARRNYEVEASIKTTPNTEKMERQRAAAEAMCGTDQSRDANHDQAIAQEKLAAEKKDRARRAAEAAAATPKMHCTLFGGYVDCL
jgi:Domain of unknown function (DUF4124)